MTLPVETDEYFGGEEDSPEVVEAITEQESKLAEVDGNKVADNASRLAELEAKNAEQAEKLLKLEKQREFWGGGGWQAMPESQVFEVTVLPDSDPTCEQVVPVIVGNAHVVNKWKLRRGEAQRVPKCVVRQLDNAKIDAWYPVPNEHGERVMQHELVKRFEFRAIPVWD